MRLVFAGTPEFAARALRALVSAGHEIPLVLTQPDRPAGRGMKLRFSPVKDAAVAHRIPVHQPSDLKTTEARRPLLDAAPDIMVVAAYGLILPEAVLSIPRRGCVNIHASLLPRWRGAAPIQRAILTGDTESGITLMQMDTGLDTGPILARTAVPIASEDTAGSLHDKLAERGAQAIVELLPRLEAGEARPEPQDERQATYAAKIAKEEARIDWSRPASDTERQVRAFDPHPGAYTRHGDVIVKIWRTRIVPGSGTPGTILSTSPTPRIACGAGALEILELQRAGGRRLAAEDYLKGAALSPGDRLG